MECGIFSKHLMSYSGEKKQNKPIAYGLFSFDPKYLVKNKWFRLTTETRS